MFDTQGGFSRHSSFECVFFFFRHCLVCLASYLFFSVITEADHHRIHFLGPPHRWPLTGWAQ